MRKVLSFVLVLALVLGSFSMAFAATPTDVVGTPNEEAVQVLMDLGVVNGYTDGSFKPAGIVTRAEMAKLIVVALGLGDYATATSTSFPDMAGATWAKGYVSYASGLGIIKGYPDGTFKPSATVSYPEAVAMIVRALGYTDASLLPATWPANYMVKGTALGILDDVNSAIGGANRGDIAGMLYNALGLAIGGIDRDGFWAASASDTMLARLGAKEVAAAVITGAESTTINLRAFVGAYAKTYTHSGDIIAVVQPESTFLTGKFKANFGTFTADSVDYTLTTGAQADVVGTVASTSAIEFYNAATIGAGVTTTSTSIEYTLAVDLSSKTIKEVYSVDRWVKSTGFLFDADMTSEIADDQTISSHVFALNDNNDIDLNSFDLLGVANLAALKVDNVVYVYKTADTTPLISKIEVGTATITGKVTKVSSDGLDYTIGGKVYSKAASMPTIAIGDTGTALLDYSGDLFKWTKTDSAEGNYALVIATAAATGVDSARIKMLTKAGDTVTYTVDSDETIVGYAKGNLVEFSTDKAGIVDSITTLGALATLTGTVSDSGKVVAGKQIASDTVVFTSTSLGSMAATTTDFDVAAVADLAGETLTSVYYYDAPTADGILEVMIVSSTLTGSSKNYAVINTTSSAIDADGNTVVFVEGFKDGVAFSAYTDKLATNVATAFTAATLYDLTINGSGVITAATPVYGVVGSLAFSALETVTAKDGNLVEINNANWFVVDPKVVVYQLDLSDLEYTAKTMSSVTTNTEVVMWQVDTNSEVIDVIVIVRP